MHNARNRRAAKAGSSRNGKLPPVSAKTATTPAFLLRRPDDPLSSGGIGFPADIVIPPHRGALPAAVLAITAPVPLPLAEPDRSGGKKRGAKKRAKSVKHHKRKASMPGKAKPAPKKPAIAPRIHLPEPVAEASPVILLPDRSEPLVQAAPDIAPAANLAPMAPPPLMPPPPAFRPNAIPPTPLPRRRAPVPWRAGGLFGLLTSWLQDGIRPIAALFAPKAKPQPSRSGKRRFRTLPPRKVPSPQEEISRLRAENERLRLQLEAVLALRERELAMDGTH